MGEPNVPTSPVQTMFVMSILIDHKLQNADYKVLPSGTVMCIHG